MKRGDIPERDMYNTFNMGVGMVMTVSRETAEAALQTLQACGIEAYTIGEIIRGEEKILL